MSSQSTVYEPSGTPIADRRTTFNEDAPHETPSTIGMTFGKYLLGKRLGAGGFGTVWSATDERGQAVALKILNRTTTFALMSLKDEVRTLLSLGHPNLVTPYELLMVEGQWAFAMEPIQGPPIDQWVEEGPPESRVSRVLSVLKQLSDAVAFLHRSNVLHLDLKPANVLVRPDGSLAVLDFGLTRTADASSPNEGQPVAGTPGYIPPEGWQGQRLGPPADWFAVGVILYQLLTGTQPFLRDLRDGMGAHTLSGAAPCIPRWPGFPPALPRLVSALLEPIAEKRAGAAEVFEALGQARETFVHPDFVGREIECDRLCQAWAMALQGTPTCTYVYGASGIGKSRLIHHFIEKLRPNDFRVMQTRCHQDEHIPFAALDGIVDHLVRLVRPHAPPTAALQAKLLPLAQIFPVVHLLLPSPVLSPSAPGAVSDPTYARKAADGLTELLVHLADVAPLLVFIDDIHWADADSLSLLTEVVSLLRGKICLILAGREKNQPNILPIRRHYPVWAWQNLSVGPLGDAEARALIRQVQGASLDDAAVQQLLVATDGNAFLVNTAARLKDSGGGLATALRSSARSLGDEAYALMELVCLGVGALDRELLARCTGIINVRRAIHLLRAGGLVSIGAIEGGEVVEPYHSQVRTAFTEAIDPMHARKLHRELWQVHAGQNGDPAIQAWHAHHAGEDQRAAALSREAATRAEHALAFGLAADHWRNALTWGVWPEDLRQQLLDHQGRALLNAGHSAEAGEVWQTLAATLGVQGAFVEERAVDAFLMAGRVEQAQNALTRALALHHLPPIRTGFVAFLHTLWAFFLVLTGRAAPAAEAPPLEARRIDLCWSAGRGLLVVAPASALPLILHSLWLAEQVGDRTRAGRVCAMLAPSLAQLPLFASVGRRFHRRAQELRSDPYQDACASMWDAYAHYYMGEHEAVEECAGKALQLLEGPCPGLPWEMARAREVRVLSAWMRGALVAYADMAAASLRAAERQGDMQGQAIAQHLCGQTALFSGDPVRAREHAEWAVQQWLPHHYTVTHFFGTALGCMVDVYEGAPDVALRRLLADEVRYHAAGGHRIPLWRIDWLITEARVRAVQPNRAAHQRRLKDIAKALATESRSDGLPQSLWVRACLLTDPLQRTQALIAARQAFEGLGLHHFALTLGVILGDASAVEALQEMGVVAPQQWAALLTPVLNTL